MGRLFKTLLIKVSLPALESVFDFHDSSLLLIFNKMGFQAKQFFILSPRGKPKYVIGHVA
jgi:hypothetical protein